MKTKKMGWTQNYHFPDLEHEEAIFYSLPKDFSKQLPSLGKLVMNSYPSSIISY